MSAVSEIIVVGVNPPAGSLWVTTEIENKLLARSLLKIGLLTQKSVTL